MTQADAAARSRRQDPSPPLSPELCARPDALLLFAEASAVLTESLDYQTTIDNLARVAVPRFADWCSVHVVEREGDPARLLATCHRDRALEAVSWRLHDRYPLSADAPHGYPHVIRTGQPELHAEVPRAALERLAVSEEHLDLLLQLATGSAIVVPLRVGGQMLGAMTLGVSVARRPYAPEDLRIAEELARRASVAVQTARLFRLAHHERERVEEASRAKDGFLALVSHELRTPLTTILGWASLLRDRQADAGTRDKAVEAIQRNARLQKKLLDDMLDLSRFVAGKFEVQRIPFSLLEVVEGAVDASIPAAAAKGVQLVAHLAPLVPPLLGDPDRLTQAITNLLSNAVRFTQSGGRVEVSLTVAGCVLRLTVRDTGVGIAADVLPHVFDRFRQGAPDLARTHRGLGLGLTIARYLVEAHGGSIRAESPGEGQGATFTLQLPVHHEASLPRSPTVSSPPILLAPGERPLAGLAVLLVEDDPDVCGFVCTALAQVGAMVAVAATVREALAWFWAKRPEVVVCDLALPREDGRALVRALRAMPEAEGGRTPALALSAHASAEDRALALAAGFQAHLAKPVEPDALVAAVARLARRTS